LGDGHPPLVVVVSGPSGVGKDALVDRILASSCHFVRPVTMTTRAPRPTEVPGRDYIFVSREDFERHLAAGELLEHAQIYGKGMYGLPREQLRRALATGCDAIVRVDVQGVAALRALLPGALFIMLVPDDLGSLERRLRERGEAHDEGDLGSRMAEAEREMAQEHLFDHVIVNVEGGLDATVQRVLDVIAQERARPGRSPVVV
jgi:guanylate kinase